MPIITLASETWAHETTVPYPFTDIHEQGAPASADPSSFQAYRCTACGKVFRVSFQFGFPFYWDETADHEQPTAIEYRWEDDDIS
jgi:hypothetical protein